VVIYFREKAAGRTFKEQRLLYGWNFFCSAKRNIEKSGNILLGDFTKYIPSESQCLNYKCIGFIVLDQILLAYRAVKDTIPSNGIIIVKLDTTRVNGLLPCYTGKCYKFAGEKIIERKINLIKIGKEEYDKL